MSRIDSVRSVFPQLATSAKGNLVTYLDSAATTLKPQIVIGRMTEYYSHESANIHRSAHALASQGTDRYEAARVVVQNFIGASSPEEIVFTKGTTEGLNLLAHCLGSRLKKGDEILLTEMEHHSNIVPWQLAAEQFGLKVRAIKVDSDGHLDESDFDSQLTDQVKVVSLTHVSNVLGCENPAQKLIRRAKAKGIVTVLDAAQSVGLRLVDVQNLACDFLVFSGHKLYGPTGIGVLYGRRSELEKLPPYQGGGSMIEKVTFSKTTYLGIPQRFEAGTPPIAEAMGLAAAIKFVEGFSSAEIVGHAKDLLNQLVIGLKDLGGVKIYGADLNRSNIVSFNLEGAHASDVGQILDQQGVAVRTGHHCCQPLMVRLGVTGTVRVSLGIYSNSSDIEVCLKALHKAKGMLQ